jgi:hypothetical protein
METVTRRKLLVSTTTACVSALCPVPSLSAAPPVLSVQNIVKVTNPGITYRLSYAISDRTRGSATPIVGGVLGEAKSENGIFIEILTGEDSSGLAFKTTSDFDGRISTSLTEVNFPFSDNFTRPDTVAPNIGLPTSVIPTLRRPYVPVAGSCCPQVGHISGNQYTADADQNCYQTQTLDFPIRRVRAAISFRNGGGNVGHGTATIIIAKSVGQLFKDSVHLQINKFYTEMDKIESGTLSELQRASYKIEEVHSRILVDLSIDPAGNYRVQCGSAIFTGTEYSFVSSVGPVVALQCYHPQPSMIDLVSWNAVWIGPDPWS